MSIFTDNVILQRDLVQVMSALADATRLRILGVLSGEPLNVNEIQAILELKQSRTSRHLQILARVGLVEESATEAGSTTASTPMCVAVMNWPRCWLQLDWAVAAQHSH